MFRLIYAIKWKWFFIKMTKISPISPHQRQNCKIWQCWSQCSQYLFQSSSKQLLPIHSDHSLPQSIGNNTNTSRSSERSLAVCEWEVFGETADRFVKQFNTSRQVEFTPANDPGFRGKHSDKTYSYMTCEFHSHICVSYIITPRSSSFLCSCLSKCVHNK